MKVSYTQYINDYESKKRQTLSVASSEAAGDTGLILGSCSSPGEGNLQPIPVFLPEKSCGQRILAGYNPWGRKVSDTTKRLSMHMQVY